MPKDKKKMMFVAFERQLATSFSSTSRIVFVSLVGLVDICDFVTLVDVDLVVFIGLTREWFLILFYLSRTRSSSTVRTVDLSRDLCRTRQLVIFVELIDLDDSAERPCRPR